MVLHYIYFGLVFCLTSCSTIFQSFWVEATASWVFTSTLVLLKDTIRRSWGSNPGPLAPEYEALPLSHRGRLPFLFTIYIYIDFFSAIYDNPKLLIHIKHMNKMIKLHQQNVSLSKSPYYHTLLNKHHNCRLEVSYALHRHVL